MPDTTPLLICSGFDPTGGAGVTQDILTAVDNGVYPLSLPTVLTTQNSFRFTGTEDVSSEYIERSVELLFEEFSPRVCKIGLLPSNEDLIHVIRTIQTRYNLRAVIDPVLKPTAESTTEVSARLLLPLLHGAIITPNKHEALLLLSLFESSLPHINTEIVEHLSGYLNGTVVLTDGPNGISFSCHGKTAQHIAVEDLLLSRDTHGTGCAFSTAVAAQLALGKPIEQAVQLAATYLDTLLKSVVDRPHSKQNYLWHGKNHVSV